MRRDDGFTLLEIIVAVVVLGFVLAGLAQATHFGISAWDAQAKFALRAERMERVERVLRQEIEQAVAPMAADDKPFAGEEHRLVFITRLPDQPPARPIQRAQVAIGVDDKRRLLLRWQVHANGVALRPLPEPAEIVLAEGVDHVDVSYRQSVEDGSKWMTRWTDSSLPALVTVQIVFRDTRVHWPLLEAATMIDTNGSF